MFKTLFHVLLSNLSQFKTSKVEPARLSKRVEKSTFEQFCDKVCPYMVVVGLIIVLGLFFIILVKYGYALTGSESNIWYYHME